MKFKILSGILFIALLSLVMRAQTKACDTLTTGIAILTFSPVAWGHAMAPWRPWFYALQ